MTINQKELIKIDKTTQIKRGFLFACTNKSEAECLNGPVFATEKVYGPVVIRIRKGDILFLNNIETNTLYGAFRALSDGGFNLVPEAYGGRYEYQVKIEPIGEIFRVNQRKQQRKD